MVSTRDTAGGSAGSWSAFSGTCRGVFVALHRAEKCLRGQTHVLVEEEKTPNDFLQGFLWLQERVCAARKFGCCRTCDSDIPDIEMYCAECVITSVLEANNNAD